MADEVDKSDKADSSDASEKADESGKAGRSGRSGRFGRSGRADAKKAPPDAKVVPDGEGPRRKGSRLDSKHIRVQVARVVGLVFLVLAMVLAAAALCIALEANRDNSFVEFVLDAAKGVDLGVFDLSNPLKEFGGENGPTKEALLNYGLGAVFYLIVGRILERVIRP